MSETPILDAVERMGKQGKKKNWKSTRPMMGRDDNKFRSNYDRIFSKKKPNEHKQKPTTARR